MQQLRLLWAEATHGRLRFSAGRALPDARREMCWGYLKLAGNGQPLSAAPSSLHVRMRGLREEQARTVGANTALCNPPTSYLHPWLVWCADVPACQHPVRPAARGLKGAF